MTPRPGVWCLLRPRILVEAARHICDVYDRARHLPASVHFDQRFADAQSHFSRARAVIRILDDLEADLERRRKDRDAGYRASDHIRTLGALIAERHNLGAGT